MESAVDSFCVVKNQIINEPSVEFVRINQEIGEVVDEFFLDSPVKSFDMSIHLRALGIGVVMGEVEFSQPFGKMLLKFRPVVG